MSCEAVVVSSSNSGVDLSFGGFGCSIWMGLFFRNATLDLGPRVSLWRGTDNFDISHGSRVSEFDDVVITVTFAPAFANSFVPEQS